MSDMNIRWLYPARCINVVDGDTIDVELDVGFRSIRTERLRLLGVNCPETKGATREAGLRAKAATMEWLNDVQFAPVRHPFPLIVETYKSDVFGRYLARVWYATDAGDPDRDLSAFLINTENAVPYDWRKT
jgi:micrococcal nuclease